jgi:hypothetical protein
VTAVGSDSDVADLIAALQPGSVIAADGLYAGMADILPDVAQQVCTCASSPCAVPSCRACCLREMQQCSSVGLLLASDMVELCRVLPCHPCNCSCMCLQPGDEAAAQSAAQTDIAEKVPRVCEALRAAMAAAGQRRFFRATLTSLSKVRQPASSACRKRLT